MARFAPDDLDRFISIPEAAARLGIGKSLGYQLANAGQLGVPVVKVGHLSRVSLRLLVDFINQTEQTAAAS